jgi:hypothetical protein
MVFGKDNFFVKVQLRVKMKEFSYIDVFNFAHVTCCLDKLFGKKIEMLKNGAITLLAFHLGC